MESPPGSTGMNEDFGFGKGRTEDGDDEEEEEEEEEEEDRAARVEAWIAIAQGAAGTLATIAQKVRAEEEEVGTTQAEGARDDEHVATGSVPAPTLLLFLLPSPSSLAGRWPFFRIQAGFT